MYLLGAYIKRHKVTNLISSKACIITTTVAICVVYFAKSQNLSWWWHYSSPLNCLQAIAWFLITLKIKIQSNSMLTKALQTTSLLSFGIYLAHVHPLMIDTESKAISYMWSKLGHAWWGLPLIGCIVFICGLIIEEPTTATSIMK